MLCMKVLHPPSPSLRPCFISCLSIQGSWSAQKVLPLLDFDSALFGFRATLCHIFMVYAEQNSPALSKNPEDFFEGDVNQGAWDKLISEVVNNKDVYEYHIYKVC